MKPLTDANGKYDLAYIFSDEFEIDTKAAFAAARAKREASGDVSSDPILDKIVALVDGLEGNKK